MDMPETRSLSAAEKCAWLRLIRSENVGPITFFRLLNRFGDAARALSALPGLAQRGGSKRVKICTPEAVETEMVALDRSGIHLIAWREPGYPAWLTEIEDPPPLITAVGCTDLLNRPTLAIVGARNASLNGRRFAHDLAEQLGSAGHIIVSGGARGIDTGAHQGALATGTVAVFAGGVDIFYPKENGDLFAKIRENGVLISEMPLGTEPQASHFPRRNRIISGMAQGVVVVEAGRRSGSLITARLALEQGREVFAVPGAPQDPRSHGTNDLIRQGAVLTEKAADVLDSLGGLKTLPLRESQPIDFTTPFSGEPPSQEVAAARSVITESLGPAPVKVDEIIRSCHLSAPIVSAVLLELELAGRLERHPGHQVSLIGAPK